MSPCCWEQGSSWPQMALGTQTWKHLVVCSPSFMRTDFSAPLATWQTWLPKGSHVYTVEGQPLGCCPLPPFLSPDSQDGTLMAVFGSSICLCSDHLGPGGCGAARGLRQHPVVLDWPCLRVRGGGRSSSKIRESSRTGQASVPCPGIHLLLRGPLRLHSTSWWSSLCESLCCCCCCC